MTYFVVGPKMKTREAVGLFSQARNIHKSAAELIDALYANEKVKIFNTEKEAMDYSVATAEYVESSAVTDWWGITLHPVYEVNLDSEVNIYDFALQSEEHLSPLESRTHKEPMPKHTFRTLPLSTISEVVAAKIPEPVRQKMLSRNIRQRDASPISAEPRFIDLTVKTENNCVVS